MTLHEFFAQLMAILQDKINIEFFIEGGPGEFSYIFPTRILQKKSNIIWLVLFLVYFGILIILKRLTNKIIFTFAASSLNKVQ
ncbi:MAG: hypothetical protein H0U75_00750 [Legionella sp.]|nr:hypothetical protein [Legionella sp.]